MSQAVLRITVEENSKAIVLKLEGRIAGPWVVELDRLWNETAPRLHKKDLIIDLRQTTYADVDGIRVLKSIYSRTGAEILAGTLWTEYLAEEITNSNESRTTANTGLEI